MSGQERHMLMPAGVTPVRQILRGTTHLVTRRAPGRSSCMPSRSRPSVTGSLSTRTASCASLTRSAFTPPELALTFNVYRASCNAPARAIT